MCPPKNEESERRGEGQPVLPKVCSTFSLSEDISWSVIWAFDGPTTTYSPALLYFREFCCDNRSEVWEGEGYLCMIAESFLYLGLQVLLQGLPQGVLVCIHSWHCLTQGQHCVLGFVELFCFTWTWAGLGLPGWHPFLLSRLGTKCPMLCLQWPCCAPCRTEEEILHSTVQCLALQGVCSFIRFLTAKIIMLIARYLGVPFHRSAFCRARSSATISTRKRLKIADGWLPICTAGLV